MARILAALAATLAALWAGAAEAGAVTTFQGAFACSDGQALAGARVELWRQQFTWLPKVPPNARQVGATTADGNGGFAFRVAGSESNFFVRVVLSSEHAEVRDWLTPWNWFADTAPNQNDVPVQDYRRQIVPGYQCRLWREFQRASRDFVSATGSRAPFGEIVVRAGAPNAGVPWTNYDTVWWPANYALSQNGVSVPQHEFAHAVRHVLDGSNAHWLVDVARFAYPQKHSARSCAPTNLGFAFNEGWAEFWAGLRLSACGAGDDLRIERNVVAALQRLQQACGLTRGQMHGVLAANPGRIHAFSDFQQLSPCPAQQARNTRLIEAVLNAIEGRRRRALEARRIVSSIESDIRSAVAEAAAAVARARRAARAPLACSSRPCVKEAQRAVDLAIARAVLEQARARREALEAITEGRRAERLARRSRRALIAAIERARARAAAREALAAAQAIREAIERLGAIRNAQSQAEIAAAIAALRDQRAAGLEALHQAINRGRPPAPRAGGPAAPPAAVVDLAGGAIGGGPTAPPAPPPAPQPPPLPPAPVERVPSNLTLDTGCREEAVSLFEPDPVTRLVTWTGRMLPAVEGTPVRMVYERSNSPTVVHLTHTDAEGRFRDIITEIEFSEGYADVWRMHAEFDGDWTRLPSRSCVFASIGRYP
jgi:hypothetical protein